MKKWKLQEWVIVGCAIITIPSLITCGVMAKSKADIRAERDLFSERYNESQVKIKALEQEIQAHTSYELQLNDEVKMLESEISSMKYESFNATMQYHEYKEETSHWFINDYDLSYDELQMMYRLVEAEVTGFGLEEKMNVAFVLMNRVYSDQFPDTIEKVIFQSRQFSCINDGRYDSVMITKSSIDAVDLAIRSNDRTYGSLYFLNKSASIKKNVEWFENRLEWVMKDKSGHEFYR